MGTPEKCRQTNLMRAAAVVVAAGVPAGLINVAMSPEVRGVARWQSVTLLDVTLIAFAVTFWSLPWARWPQRAQLVVVPVGAVLTIWTALTYGYLRSDAPVDGIPVFIVLSLLWLGLSQPSGTAAVVGPLCTAPVLAFEAARAGTHATVPSFGLLAICTLAAEALAYGQSREAASVRPLRSLVQGAQRLDIAVSGNDLPSHLAAVACDALGGTAGIVYQRSESGDVPVAVYPEHFEPPPPGGYSRTQCGRVAIPLPEESELAAVEVILPRRAPIAAAEYAGELLRDLLVRFVHDRLRVERQLAVDALTSVGNRVALDAALAKVQPTDAVVIFDIDRFKNVNDLLGHVAGDDVLRHVASFLKTQLRSTDSICRYGGDEFLVVLKDTPKPEAVIDRILSSWQRSDPLVTISTGLAIAGPGESPIEALQRADMALYQAKRNGRDCWTAAPAAT